MTAAAEQTLEFQAETTQLLDLMVHSLYTNKDVFLRELISNASDALDDFRFRSMTQPELFEGNQKLEIRLAVNAADRTLTISDTGIGMTRQEVIDNIGTIARSGTRELKQKMRGEMPATSELIGQFGVGFYSAFMAASRIRLVTRRAGEAMATEWESTGGGVYTIRDAEKRERGTTITLDLWPPDADTGIEDYAEPWRLSAIVRRYSDFISYPIVMVDQREETVDGRPTTTIEDRVLNSMTPIWTRPPAEVSEDEYGEFYRHVARDGGTPLKTIHFRAEGTFAFDSLLYLPSQAPYDLYYAAPDAGLRLYSARVLVVDKTEELLPRYLRFVRGVVDAFDLPLNISRQRLQQDSHTAVIRKHLTRKVLTVLEEMFDKDRERYLTFWSQFGPTMKEGAATDADNRSRLQPLLLFQSSASESLTTLRDYVGRMKPGQREILYLTAESRSLVENSPHLEAVKAAGLEALYLVDPVDELLLQHLTEYDGRKLKSAGKGVLDLGEADNPMPPADQYQELLRVIQKTLDPHVKQVRLSTRLKHSPLCLVVEEHDYSPMLERLLQKGKGGGLKQRRVLELNPHHQLIEALRTRSERDGAEDALGPIAEVLFGLGLLAEGSELPDPSRFTRLAYSLLAPTV